MIRDLLEQANDIQTKLNQLKKAQEQMLLLLAKVKYETHHKAPTVLFPRGEQVTVVIIEDSDPFYKLRDLLR